MRATTDPFLPFVPCRLSAPPAVRQASARPDKYEFLGVGRTNQTRRWLARGPPPCPLLCLLRRWPAPLGAITRAPAPASARASQQQQKKKGVGTHVLASRYVYSEPDASVCRGHARLLCRPSLIKSRDLTSYTALACLVRSNGFQNARIGFLIYLYEKKNDRARPTAWRLRPKHET